MPATVFPAPGSPSGTQFLAPLGAFDIAPRGGGTFKNLLQWSQDLYQSSWTATNVTITPTASTSLSSGGTSGTNNFVVLSATGIAVNQSITGTGITAGTYVIAVVSTTVYLSSRFSTTGSGTYNFYDPNGVNTVTSSSNTQALSQTVSVTANTAYTLSFYAKKGTATDATYNIYNNTAASDIIAPTSYYNNININPTITASGLNTARTIDLGVPFFNTYSNSFGSSNTIYSTSIDVRPTGNFTFEGWFYFTGSGQNTMFCIGDESANRIVFFQTSSTGALSYNVFGGSVIGLTGVTAPNRTWTHIAIERVGNNLTPYVNGVAGVTSTVTGTLGNANGFLVCGQNTSGVITGQGAGFFSNLRLVLGSAVYNGNFTVVSSPLTNIANTKLLLCQDSNPIKDNSSNNYTLTNFGSVVSINGNITLYPGMSITAGSGITAGTRVVSIVGPIITLSAANTGAVSGSITFSDTNWQRITVPFTTPVGCTSIIVRPLSTLSSGFGTTLLTGLQLETGSSATPYQLTVGSSPAAQGLVPPSINYSIVNKIQQRRALAAVPDNRRFLAKIQQRRALVATFDDLNDIPKIQTFFLPANRIGITVSDVKDFGRLRPYDPDLPVADFKIPITGQNLDPSTPTFSVGTIYLDQSSNEGYIWVKNTPSSVVTKTLYFANQSTLRFDIGSTIRISNVNTGYIESGVVTACTFRSVSYTGSDLPVEVSGTFVETGATLYPQTTVRTTTSPTNARENLFYSRLSPGLRNNSTVTQGISYAEVNDDRKNISSLSKQLITYKETVDRRKEAYNLSKFDPGSLTPDFSILVIGQNLDPSTSIFSVSTIYLEQDPTDGYILNKTTPSPTVTKTLYFAKQSYILFPVGSVMRIRNINIGYSLNVIVTACTFNSVSYTGSDLPVDTSGTYIDSGTTLYPQSSVRLTTAPSNPRENLFYAVLAPGLYSNSTINQGRSYVSISSNITSGKTASVNTARGVNESNLSRTINLSRFDPGVGTSDVSIPITGQNLDSTTGVYSTATIYLDQGTDDGYLWSDNTSMASTKTLYFAVRLSIPFLVGEVIRIRNANNGYSVNVIVTACTNRSVSYTGADLPVDTSGTFVESGFTLYPQRSVVTTTAPTNARENLYYFNIAPGERANRAWGIGPMFAADTATEVLKNYQLEKPILKITSDNNRLSYAKLSSISVLRSEEIVLPVEQINPAKFSNNTIFDFTTPYIAKLLAITVLREDKIRFSRENLEKQIAKLSNGDPLDLVVENLSKQLQKLVVDNTNLGYAKLSSISVLRSEEIVLPVEQINPVKFNNNTIFDFPSVYAENLEKQIAKLSNGDPLRLLTEKLAAATVLREDKIRFSTENLSKQLQKLVIDNAILEIQTSKIKAVSVLIEVRDGLIFAKGNLQKQLERLQQDQTNLNSGKLRDVSPLKDTAAQIFDVDTRLETFDNLGIYNEITSRIIASSTISLDVVNYYVYDQDIMGLKIITSAETQLLTYSNFDYPRINRYPPGTRVQLIDSATGAIYITQVLSSTVSTITIPFILGFPSSMQYGTISSQSGPSVYPRNQVRPTTKPSNARERLYYAELIPTLYTPRNVEFSPIYPIVPPEATIEADSLERLKIYDFTTVEADSEGKIQIMKTGDFKPGSVGIQDPAYVKKEPIQFWN